MQMTSTEAVGIVFAMGAVIFFCRAFPFIFFSRVKTAQSKGTKAFLNYVERIAPPVAMTVLAFNALGPSLGNLARTLVSALSSSPVPGEFHASLAVFIAAVLTCLTHVWKRNALISIFGGTAVYMILQRLFS